MAHSLDLDWLRAELKKPGRSQTELARSLGLHVSAVNKILSATRSVKLGEYEKILEYLTQTSRDKREVVPPKFSAGTHLSENMPTLIDVDWVCQRSVLFPPGNSINIDRKLLSLLADGNERDLVAVSTQLIVEELVKCIILHMRWLDDREVDQLTTILADINTSTIFARGLGIIDVYEGHTIRLLYSAFTTSSTQDSIELSGSPREDIRSALEFEGSDGGDRVWLRLVKFVTGLYDRLVDHQIARRDAVLASAGLTFDDLREVAVKREKQKNLKSNNLA